MHITRNTHIFKYSVRKGTRAEKMPDQVPEETKTVRSNVLLQMTARHKDAYEEQWIGQKEEILAEEFVEVDGRQYLVGHTKRYVKVGIETTKDLTGQLVNVDIVGKIDGNMLVGKIQC